MQGAEDGRPRTFAPRVDDFYAQQKPSGKYTRLSRYNDFRELLAKEKIDAG